MKRFHDCTRLNLTGLEEKLFDTRIKAFQELQKLNPKRVITYDRRCSEMSVDGNIVFVKFKKVEKQFKVYCIDIWDKSYSSGYDTYIG